MQRIAIARALLNDPAILIFDEAISALDAESERTLQTQLKEIMAERTTFVIAHRVSTIRNADRIVVLDQGEIVEVGYHQDLIAREGLYCHLVNQQSVL